MAIIRTGPIASDISGTIGSVVFVAGGRSTVARPRPIQRTKTSPFLARTKSRMQLIRNHWSTLTTLQQDLWRTAANDIQRSNRLGQASALSGFTYFVMTNRVAFPGAFQIVDEPSALTRRDTPLDPTVAFSASGTFAVQIRIPLPLVLLGLQVYGWPFWVDHATRDVARLVFLVERFQLADPITHDVRPTWIEHFGDMVQGQRFAVGIKARQSNSPFNPLVIIQDTVSA